VETIIVKMINPCNLLTLDSIEFKVYDYLPINLLSADTFLCQDAAVRLQVGDDSDFTYHWSAMPADYGDIANTGAMLTSGYPDSTTQYSVYATFQGCTSLPLTFTATVEPTPIPQILTLDTTVCLRDSMQLRVAIGPSYFSNYFYTWSPGINLSDPFVREPKFFSQKVFDWKYVISAQTPLGCTGTDSIIIKSRPPMDLVNVTQDTVLRYGNSLQLNAEGADNYVWVPTSYLNDPNIANPVSQPEEPVVYTLYAANFWGCRDTATVKVAIDYNMSEYIPNAFSPNGDGLNDEFKVFSVRYQKLLEFRVFNRWGREVFSTTDINKGWDGNYQGTPQEMGIYNYIIRVARPDGQIKTYKGDLTLLR
jgi:gliding motility-associated-like protein